MIQMKKARQNLRIRNLKMWISNVSDKEFQVMFIKMLTELRRRMNEHNENLNNDIENRRKCQTKMITAQKIY